MATQNGDQDSGSSSDNAQKRSNSYEPDFDSDPKILPITGRTRCISERSDLLSDISDALPTAYRRKKKYSFNEKRPSNFSDSNFLLSQFDGVSSFNDKSAMELFNYENRRMSLNSARTLDRKYDTESTLSPDFNSKEVDDIDSGEADKGGSGDPARSSVDRTNWVEPLIKVFPPTPSRQVYSRYIFIKLFIINQFMYIFIYFKLNIIST
jgi:hypothetical protein